MNDTRTVLGPSIRQAISCVNNGGIIAYPTEAVYGLGCDPQQPSALQKLVALKQRPSGKGFILLAADWSHLAPYLAPLSTEQIERANRLWPGPFTWVIPAASNVPEQLIFQGTIAVRLTAHPLARALCQAAGRPLVSTSANLSGQPPLVTGAAVHRLFGHAIDYILAGDTGRLKQPTPIRDLISMEWLRKGDD